MPKMFRTMLIQNDKPMLGPSKIKLGVKIDGEAPDIVPNENGEVSQGNRGMSVSPSFQTLPAHHVPDKFHAFRVGARGKNENIRCWSMGIGEFSSCDLDESLSLYVDIPGKHGVISPKRKMAIAEFQVRLAATRDEWVIDEPEIRS